MPNKDKAKIVEHNNKQNKMFNKATPGLDETNLNSALTSLDLNMRMNLKLKN